MGKKQKKPGKGKEKTERKTAKAVEKRARRDDKKLSEEDDIDAILVLTYSLLREFVFVSSFFRCHWPSILKFSSYLRRAVARFEVARNPKTLTVSLCKIHGRGLGF